MAGQGEGDGQPGDAGAAHGAEDGAAPGVVPVAGAGVAQVPYPGTPPAGTHPSSDAPSHLPPAADPVRAAPPPHRWGLGAYLLAEVVFLLTASVVLGFAGVGQGPPSVGLLTLGLALPSLLAAAAAVLITRLRGNGPRIDLRLEWSWSDVGLGVAFGLGGLVLTIPASVLYIAIVGEDASSAVGEVFGNVTASPVLAVTVLIVVVLVAPLCEEILYRGLLWGGVERLAGRWTAFAVTTLLFALAHFEFTRTPLLLVVAIPIGAARLYTDRLLASIVAHQVNNLLPGIALMLALLGVVPLA